jgi:hypothetical protein
MANPKRFPTASRMISLEWTVTSLWFVLFDVGGTLL